MFQLPRVIVILLVVMAFTTAANRSRAADPGEEATFFTQKVLPLLQQRCFQCHSHATKKAKGGLVLDTRSGWEKGGDSGPSLQPGNLEKSLLIQAVRYQDPDLQMPPDAKLPAAEIAILEQWVKTGAYDPRKTEPAPSQTGSKNASGSDHWAFQPLKQSSVPSVQRQAWPWTDIDQFLLARMEQAGLTPVADTDRYTWLRRVSFDLTGLPPTSVQIAEFLADDSPLAFDRVVDRLLASPAFGERWARHWLDLTGYADQIGTSNNVFAEHAWRYREYVIAAFNADKPWDQFLREQLAGDLLPAASEEQRALQLTATGYLLLGDLTIVEADKAKLRVDTIDQQIDKIGKSMLGMTLACTRCHDHKFDPITQRDYYALAGILNSTESVQRSPYGGWSYPVTADLPETSPQKQSREELSKQNQTRMDSLRAEKTKLEARRKELDESLQKSKAPPTDPERMKQEQERKEIDPRLKKIDADLLHGEFFGPKVPVAFAVHDLNNPQDMQVTIRGNPHALGDKVPRGFPKVIAPQNGKSIPEKQSGRLQLAEWITSRDNPLTARVTVNRIWQKLFGEGLVQSVDYFGSRGELPTHPELLDHLARRFMDDGWSQKKLIRSLVLSHAYRLSSRPSEQAAKLDPMNRWLSHMARRRLDAEAIHDGLLVASGKLVTPTLRSAIPFEYAENSYSLAKTEVNPPAFALNRYRPEQEFVRTVYLPVVRSGRQPGPAEARNMFDFTQPGEIAGRRSVTTVPTQALFLMNSKSLKTRSHELAELLRTNSNSDVARITELWMRVYNRPVTPQEITQSLDFLASIRQQMAALKNVPPDQIDLKTWAELCHALFSSNEFLTLL
ncbi:MAG: DUF1549 domain-containing protein [Planctomycetales bacterium]